MKTAEEIQAAMCEAGLLGADLPKGTKIVLDQENGSGKFPGVWTIVKINQASYGLDQHGVPLRAHKSLCRVATDAEITAFENAPKPIRFIPGQLVMVPRASNMDTHGFYVVLSVKGMNPRDKAKLAKLGGEGVGRTWTCSLSLLVPVTTPTQKVLADSCILDTARGGTPEMTVLRS